MRYFKAGGLSLKGVKNNNNDVFDKATDLLKARAGRYLYDPAS